MRAFPILDVDDLRRGVFLAHVLAEATGVPAPRVVTQLPRDIERGSYAADTRTLILSCATEEVLDVVTHEFQHYLDHLHGRKEPGGWPRGRHAPDFYERLEELEQARDEWLSVHAPG